MPPEGGMTGRGPPLAEPPDPERSDEALTGGAGVGVEGGAGVVGAECVAVEAAGYWASLRPDMCGRRWLSGNGGWGSRWAGSALMGTTVWAAGG